MTGCSSASALRPSAIDAFGYAEALKDLAQDDQVCFHRESDSGGPSHDDVRAASGNEYAARGRSLSSGIP